MKIYFSAYSKSEPLFSTHRKIYLILFIVKKKKKKKKKKKESKKSSSF